VNLEDAASAAHELGLKPPDAWAQDAVKLVIPKDPASGEPLVYDGYKGQQMKQADPELLIYPLGLITEPGLIRKMLATYPPRISPGGPAMTDSIYTTIAARQGMTNDAMRFFRHSYEPFLVAPFDQISEKHSHVRQYCFLTGFGGLLQSVEYGMGGITIADGQITACAHLPAVWKKLTITGIHFRGQTYDLEAASGQTALTRHKGSESR
jgi:trehalose/maltose hydrolase-like predicted phosphorylase